MRRDLDSENLLFKEGNKYLDAGQMNKDFPNGRGIFVTFDKSLVIWVN